MNGLKVITDHITISQQNQTIKLDDQYVIGISIENKPDSQDVLKYGLNVAPHIDMVPGERSRPYGGFHACGVPCHYGGEIRLKFDTNNGPKALVILTILTTTEKEIK